MDNNTIIVPLCPMTFNNAADVSPKCVKELCEWWLEDKQRCAVSEIAIKVGAKK